MSIDMAPGADIDQDLTASVTTSTAAALTGRSEWFFRDAAARGALTAASKDENGHWWIRLGDALAYHQRQRVRRAPDQRQAVERAAAVLAAGPLDATEAARRLGISPGNARKSLCQLSAEGRAERSPDGLWTLIEQ